jgi:hypothetical protein
MAVSLAIIIILGLGADYLFRRLKLPGLMGMLLVGMLVGPHVLGLLRPEMMAVSADFRKIALIVISLRAGFELRRDTLHRPAILMSSVPALFEITAVVFVAPFFLHLTYLEAAILGAKGSGKIWKVIEEKELWVSQPGEAGASVELVPALVLRYWRVYHEESRGRGRTLRHHYTPGDRSFDHHWEILAA